MNQKLNYETLRENLMKTLEPGTKVLLHCCCGPCASSVIERLGSFFDLTVFYYNPCIMDKEEYLRRKLTLESLVDKINSGNGPYTTLYPVKYLEADYNNEEFLNITKGYETAPEGGERCTICFGQRLKKTKDLATKNGFKYFCSTLTVSPHKDHLLINKIGESLSDDKTKWLPSDFKKNNGYLRSTELSKELGLYRQDYCGCIFSKSST